MQILTVFYPQIPVFYHKSVYIYSNSMNFLAKMSKMHNIIMNLLAQIHSLIHY